MGKERVAVVGIGQTKHQATRGDVSMAGLLREAAQRALADAQMTWTDIDAVVPITIGRLAEAQARTCSSVPAGRVKSISTSQAPIAADTSVPIATLPQLPGARSTAEPNEMPSVEVAASRRAWPMRPPAPAMPTRTVLTS